MGIFTVVPIVFGLFALLPAITIPADSFAVYMEKAFDVLEVVFYVLPADTVFAIFSIILALQAWRIVVSVLRTLWDVLPIF